MDVPQFPIQVIRFGTNEANETNPFHDEQELITGLEMFASGTPREAHAVDAGGRRLRLKRNLMNGTCAVRFQDEV